MQAVNDLFGSVGENDSIRKAELVFVIERFRNGRIYAIHREEFSESGNKDILLGHLSVFQKAPVSAVDL